MSEPPHSVADAENALRRGDFARADLLARQLLETQPAEAHTIIGISKAKRGQRDEALAHLKSALEIDPKFTPALIAQSQILSSIGRVDEALAAAMQAAEAEPSDPETVSYFATVLASMGRALDAVGVLAQLAAAHQEDVRVWDNLARAQRGAGLEFDAKTTWIRASQMPRVSEGIWLSLGQLHLAHGDFAEAQACAQQAVRINPASSAAQTLLALSLAESGDADAAETALRRAIKLNPTDPLPRASLGFWMQEQGRFDEAAPMLEKAVAIQPTNGFAHYNIVRAKKADGVTVERLSSVLARGGVSPRDEQYLHYALGKANEDIAEFETAMRHYDIGNEKAFDIWLARRPWDRDDYAAQVDATIQRHQSFDAETANNSELPLLIVGMIRSGTTLVEQILSSHPQVAGAGELPFWHESATRAEDHENLQSLSREYLAELESKGSGALRVTDKLPHNYFMLGVIHSALPSARIIHVRRNPLDNCLSVYTTAYQRPPVFAHNRANIVFAYQQYEKLMQHWRSVLPPDRFLEVDYEAIVADREGVTRQLVQFAGLPWRDECLAHEKNTRAVRTPSLWQVRQPIYSTSIARWKRFEPWLGDFKNLMASRETND